MHCQIVAKQENGPWHSGNLFNFFIAFENRDYAGKW